MATIQHPHITEKKKAEIRRQITLQLETLKGSGLMRWLVFMVFMAMAVIAPSLLFLVFPDMTVLLYIFLAIASVAGFLQALSVISNSYIRKKFLRAANTFNEVYADATEERIFATEHLIEIASMEENLYRDASSRLLNAVGEPFWKLGIMAPGDHKRREVQRQINVCMSVHTVGWSAILKYLTISAGSFGGVFTLLELLMPVSEPIFSLIVAKFAFSVFVALLVLISSTNLEFKQKDRAIKTFEEAFAFNSPERTFAMTVFKRATNGDDKELKAAAECIVKRLEENLLSSATQEMMENPEAVIQKELQHKCGTDTPLQTDTDPADEPGRMEESSRSYSRHQQIALEPDDYESRKTDIE